MRHQNNSFYLTVFKLLKQDKSPAKIAKELKVSNQKINYYIRYFKKEGLLLKKGYGTWETKEVKRIHLEHPTQQVKRIKEIRGHAFIWTIKLHKEFDWVNKLGTTQYKLIRGYIPRIIINNRKIWFGKKTITIYEPHSFYGRNAIESKKYAVINLLEVLRALESKFGINLQPYVFTPAREHYGLIKNDLAQQYNRKGEKLHIRDDLEGEWLWIDDSLSLEELETGSIKALTRSVQVQNWYNDMKKHDFKVTPSFILESIGGMVQVQQMNSDNIVKHQKVLDEMLITLKQIRKNLSKR
jgi:hypothetical protein